MAVERILRLNFADDRPDSFVLLHIAGERLLPSLKLTASDGDETFRITSKSKLFGLRSALIHQFTLPFARAVL